MRFFRVATTGDEGACEWQASHTLVLPLVSVGNVGQLAVEMLLTGSAELSTRQVGALESDLVLPCSGSTPQGRLILPLEVYQSGDRGNKSLSLIQQRSPVAAGMHEQFASELAPLLKSATFREVVVVGSLDAKHMTDSQLRSRQYVHYIVVGDDGARPEAVKEMVGHLEAAGVHAFEGGLVRYLDAQTPQHYGSLLIQEHLEDLCSGGRVVVLLVVMCHEGDNSMEAALGMNALAAATGVEKAVAGSTTPFPHDVVYGAPHPLSSY
mmetsp:Transcript_4253/g.15305  ORF Transcript_4253/g.15305 Transcript_4253/m.15305 type:complete len:266 (+) Transcript_4253:277-1074(+)